MCCLSNTSFSGYRNALPQLEEWGYNVDMPALAQQRSVLFSTQQSNISERLSQLSVDLCPQASNYDEVDSEENAFSSQNDESGIITTQPSSSTQSASSTQPGSSNQPHSSNRIPRSPRRKKRRKNKPKNKQKKQRPFESFRNSKQMTAGASNQSRRTSSKREVIEVLA